MNRSDSDIKAVNELIWSIYEYMPERAEKFLKRCFPYLLPFRNLSVPISVFQGSTYYKSYSGTLVGAGSEDHLRYIIDLYFKGEWVKKEGIKVPLWNLPHALEAIGASADLTVCHLDRISSSLLFDKGYLAVPEWVGSILEVPETLDNITRGNRSLRSDIKTLEDNKLTFRISHEESDFDRFYYKMYIPFIRNRHGKQAFIRNIHWTRRAFNKGGLILVFMQDKMISALLFRQRNKVIDAIAFGIIDGREDLLKEGASSATDLFIIEHAKETGCTHVDFGGSRPCLTDGVLRFKRKWGVSLIDKEDGWYNFLIKWNKFDEKIAHFLSKNPLIFRDGGGLSAIKAVDSHKPLNGTNTKHIADSLWVPGLKNFFLISRHGWNGNSDISSNTILIDSKEKKFLKF